MRLLSFSVGGDERRLGVLSASDTVHDLTDALGVRDVGELLAGGYDVGTIVDLRTTTPQHALADVTVRAPIARPGKIICVGLNYHDHCREQNVEPPSSPMFFGKFANAVADPGASVVRPVATEKLDAECELAVVIGRRASRIGRVEAREAIFGYTVMNDVSMRDLQREDRQWLRAKGSDGFAPLGPVVVTTDEIPDPRALHLRSSVNGATWQDSTTAEMVFDVFTLVAFASRTITLEPGDLVATGTPAGVGHFQSPPRYLADGDLVRCEIEGIGAIENRIVDETPRIGDHAAAAGIAALTRSP